MAENKNVTNRRAGLVGNYYERESKIDDDMKALMQKLAEMKANKQRAAKKNRQYLALRIFELFFENSELGKIFAYNRGDIFRSEEKVETLLIMFDEVAEKIKEDNETFGLKGVDFANQDNAEDEEELEDIEKNTSSYYSNKTEESSQDTSSNENNKNNDDDEDEDEEEDDSKW